MKRLLCVVHEDGDDVVVKMPRDVDVELVFRAVAAFAKANGLDVGSAADGTRVSPMVQVRSPVVLDGGGE